MRFFTLFVVPFLSGGEDLAALVAATGEHVAAVTGLHALTEAVYLLALPLFGLECSKHLFAPLSVCDISYRPYSISIEDRIERRLRLR